MTHVWPGHSVIVLPVPGLESFVRDRHAHYDPAYVSADPTFAHAHVTLLGPWLAHPSPTELARVGEILRSIGEFTYEANRVATFPNGIIHAVPEPAAPFERVTALLAHAFPSCPPYAGQHRPSPHVTLDAVGPGVDEAVVRGWVAPLLPLRGRAEAAHLSWYEQHVCRTLHRWPLGAAAVRGRERPVEERGTG